MRRQRSAPAREREVVSRTGRQDVVSRQNSLRTPAHTSAALRPGLPIRRGAKARRPSCHSSYSCRQRRIARQGDRCQRNSDEPRSSAGIDPDCLRRHAVTRTRQRGRPLRRRLQGTLRFDQAIALLGVVCRRHADDIASMGRDPWRRSPTPHGCPSKPSPSVALHSGTIRCARRYSKTRDQVPVVTGERGDQIGGHATSV
jgi:hypothetical protein